MLTSVSICFGCSKWGSDDDVECGKSDQDETGEAGIHDCFDCSFVLGGSR